MSGIVRSIHHWTAGAGRASDVDKEHYHKITERDGTVVFGTEEIADNIVSSDGDYAAHTRRLNSGSAGFAMAGMRGAVEFPFDAGNSPITRTQFEAHCKMTAEFHMDYGIPVTPVTCLTHAEVEPTLGVKQRGKWDFTRLPFEPGIVGAIPVGNYFRERVLSYMDDDWKRSSRPVLSIGDRGAFVRDAQSLMRDVGFFAGKVDGIFGPRTKAQVLAFQAASNLHPDGIIGDDTWRALMKPVYVPKRSITEQELRESGSETIEIADTGEKRMKQGAATTIGLGTVDVAISAAEKVKDAESTLATVQAIVLDNWPILILIMGGLVAFKYGPELMQRLRGVRTRDATSGANLRR